MYLDGASRQHRQLSTVPRLFRFQRRVGATDNCSLLRAWGPKKMKKRSEFQQPRRTVKKKCKQGSAKIKKTQDRQQTGIGDWTGRQHKQRLPRDRIKASGSGAIPEKKWAGLSIDAEPGPASRRPDGEYWRLGRIVALVNSNKFWSLIMVSNKINLQN